GLKGNPYNESSPIVEVEYVQSGIPLPAAIYTTRTDGSDAVLKRYRDFLAELFVSVGTSPAQAEKQAREVVTLESRLARSHDTVAHLEKRRLPQLQAKYPNVPWAKFADKYQLPAATVYQVYHPAYYDTLNKLLKTVPLSVWKQKAKADYLLFNAPRLSNKTARQHFELFEITVRKAEKTYSREDQARELMENFYSAVNLADVSGDIFARSVLGKEDKAKMNQMAEHIRRVFLSRLGQNRWLSPQAKAKAIRKLQAMIFKVGYPKKTAGESLLFTPDNYAKNYALLYAERQKAYLLSLGKPKPRGQWQRNQWSIAGSYQSETNSFEIVSGLLQPPFFQKGADDAVLYGTVGSIIAHEITHGLDNNGKDYNETGVKENWWTAADTLNFNKLTQPLAEQFSSYLVMDNTYLNGKITLGENIADLVGLQVAYEAFTQSSQFRDNKNIDGFTPTQRFLIAFAQQWRSKYTDQILKEYFLSDVHPPDNLRVNGTLSNFEPFYKSFNVQPAHALYRPQLVRIW
ncbi:MAG: M13 family metallopeptidase, partial [Cytophagales bacterium]|nr:M13 family metallopeptidase [Cytophagales bacterium]